MKAARLDIRGLFEAVDRLRCERRMARKAVAAQLGVVPAVLTRWQYGSHPGGQTVVAAVDWLDADLRDFFLADAKTDEAAL
jgi:hypothetical protein